MKKTIYFITGNKYKLQIARKVFAGSGIEVLQEPLETPEIQNNDIGEIASFSAKWAVDIVKKPIFLTDAGCYIEALNGFPGPYVKFINGYLSSADYLRLMQGKTNRRVVFKDCIAYCEPDSEPILFFSEAEGIIADKPGKKGTTSINEVFIPYGFDRTESEIPREIMVDFWAKYIVNYENLLEYVRVNFS